MRYLIIGNTNFNYAVSKRRRPNTPGNLDEIIRFAGRNYDGIICAGNRHLGSGNMYESLISDYQRRGKQVIASDVPDGDIEVYSLDNIGDGIEFRIGILNNGDLINGLGECLKKPYRDLEDFKKQEQEQNKNVFDKMNELRLNLLIGNMSGSLKIFDENRKRMMVMPVTKPIIPFSLKSEEFKIRYKKNVHILSYDRKYIASVGDFAPPSKRKTSFGILDTNYKGTNKTTIEVVHLRI